MALILVLGVALAVGASIGRWWVPVLPLAMGSVVAASLAVAGRGVADTPIAFAILAATAPITIGVLLRRRASGTPTVP